MASEHLIFSEVPHLKYVKLVWYSTLKKHGIVVENVQRRAIRCLETLIRLSYHERLKMLDIQTLELEDNEAEGFKYAKF